MSLILLEALGVVVLAVLGVVLGWWCCRRPWWLVGYMVPLGIILLIGMAHRHRPLEMLPPFSWLMAGRMELALLAVCATMVLTTPLLRLPRVRDRVAVTLLMIVAVGQVCIMPFLAPALNLASLRALQTQVDSDGICRQGTDYTCGPAAAVTLLRRMGLPAEESELALLCRTSSFMGTPPDVLAKRLQSLYGECGLNAVYRSFESLDELAAASHTLALMRFSLFLDHYVAVLEVNRETVVVGDPLLGRTVLTAEEFERGWRRVGVVLDPACNGE